MCQLCTSQKKLSTRKITSVTVQSTYEDSGQKKICYSISISINKIDWILNVFDEHLNQQNVQDMRKHSLINDNTCLHLPTIHAHFLFDCTYHLKIY